MDPRREVTKVMPGMELVHKRKLLSDEGRKLTECEAMLRRARQREYKDEFKPAREWEGPKEGYFFGTGNKGTGYYLDEEWCDFNDPDENGYVLVRTPPAVAVARALRKRQEESLLFSKEFLEALGPAHGTPNHRYKLVTPPWLCGTKPPRETFVKKAEVCSGEVSGRNELLFERLNYLMSRRGDEESSRPARVEAKKGAIVRKDVGLSSDMVGELACGASVLVVEELEHEGKRRARLSEPVCGWVSSKTLNFSAPTTSLVVSEHESLCTAIVAVETRSGGRLNLRGEELVPVIESPGPFAFELSLRGPEARDMPLTLKITIKRGPLAAWSVAKLIDAFKAKLEAKYDVQPGAIYRLYEEEEKDIDDSGDKNYRVQDYVDPSTRLAELVKVFSSDSVTKLVVKRKLGADDAKPIVFPRAIEVARRRELEAPEIDENSTHADVIKARAMQAEDGLTSRPQTSEEIRQYWADRKNEKHWRTSAALKGFATRTDDKAKLEKWASTLQPKTGFFNDNAKPLY